MRNNEFKISSVVECSEIGFFQDFPTPRAMFFVRFLLLSDFPPSFVPGAMQN